MIDTVRSRPNHYEMLGLSPSASSDQIAQAFARELGRISLRPFGSLAEISVAYETLRDPIKRVAYDASLRPKPEAKHSLIGRLEGTPFLGRTSADPVKQPDVPPLAPRIAARPEPRPEPTLPAFIIGSPRSPADPNPRESQPKAVERPRPRIVGNYAPPRNEAARTHHAEDARFDWKLPALAGGALILAIGLGAWTGVEAGNDVEAEQPLKAATVKIPPPDEQAGMTALPIDPAPVVSEAQPERQGRGATPRTARNRPPLQIDLPDVQPAEVAQIDQAPPEDIATDQAQSPAVAATAAKLPLPNSVIARTIGRIGYPCGQVASVDGGTAGVFKVTCTSGHSYRAAPVRGRYRFRQLGRR